MALEYSLKWHDLEDTSGGGGTIDNPTIDITVVNPNETPMYFLTTYVEDGKLCGNYEETTNCTKTITTTCVYVEGEYSINLYNISADLFNYTYTLSDAVDCAVHDAPLIHVNGDNPSFTITIDVLYSETD